VDIAVHIKKCPLVKQIKALKSKPYYEEGINSGSDREDDSNFRSLSCIHGKCTRPREVEGIWTSEIGDKAPVEGNKAMDKGECKQQAMQNNSSSFVYADTDATQNMKRKAIFAMSGHEFYALVDKIESAHSVMCQNNIHNSYLQPDACDKWLNAGLDRRLPFQEKHAIQQASILGNLEMMGIIRRPKSILEMINHSESREGNRKREERKGIESQVKVIEFGAGRGYLTHMLSDCYGIKDIVLVERRSYKFKADRTLRQAEGVNLERLRIDIKDLNLEAVESLKGFHYAAVGKHLCGPATDLALRCCFHGKNSTDNVSEDVKTRGSCPCIKGLAIATCCHHLCQWKSYVNKSFFLNLGFTREEFCAITWLTSWALDGEHCSEHSDDMDLQADLSVCDTVEAPANVYDEMGDIIRCLKPAGRAMLGMKCKEILDTGRLVWLREQGLNAKLVNYVPARVSPENRLLLARKDGK
ncbi:hypothetical protein KI387_034830, partial [Taxus chinensis]